MKEIKVLIFSHMYPNKMDHNYGIFIHNHVKHLLEEAASVKVISPVPYAPRVMQYKSKWKYYHQIPGHDVIDRVHIDYSRYICFPGKLSRTVSCYTMYYGILKTLNSAINKYKPEVLHMHTATPDGYVGLLLKKKYNLPLVCSLRGSDINSYPYRDRLTMLLTKKVISEADQLISVSHALKSVAESIAKPKNPIEAVYNGCNLESFVFNEHRRLQYRKKIGISPLERAIIFVGDIKESKGVFELINAFNKLNSSFPNLHLIFLGSDSGDTTIKNIISSSNLHNKIHLVGSKPHNEVAHWLCAADIFALPSYNEGMPNAVIEAMACGLPVIATRVGGIPEIVTEDTGILVSPKNTELLVRGIKQMLSKKWDRDVIRSHVEDFTWERNAKETMQIYRNVLCKFEN